MVYRWSILQGTSIGFLGMDSQFADITLIASSCFLPLDVWQWLCYVDPPPLHKHWYIWHSRTKLLTYHKSIGQKNSANLHFIYKTFIHIEYWAMIADTIGSFHLQRVITNVNTMHMYLFIIKISQWIQWTVQLHPWYWNTSSFTASSSLGKIQCIFQQL